MFAGIEQGVSHSLGAKLLRHVFDDGDRLGKPTGIDQGRGQVVPHLDPIGVAVGGQCECCDGVVDPARFSVGGTEILEDEKAVWVRGQSPLETGCGGREFAFVEVGHALEKRHRHSQRV